MPVLAARRCATTGRDIALYYDLFLPGGQLAPDDYAARRLAAPPPADEPPLVVLVSPLGSQCTNYTDELCRAIATGASSAGARVCRFDNRDVGLSTHLDGVAALPVWRMALPAWLSPWERVPYSLDDMADDTLALVAALTARPGAAPAGGAHLLGCSMGGMIAQLAAIKAHGRALGDAAAKGWAHVWRHAPPLVASLASCMSTAGGPGLPRAPLWVQLRMIRPAPRDATLQELAEFKAALGADVFAHGGRPPPPAWLLARALAAVRRSTYGAGTARQLSAILRAPSREAALTELAMPVTVIHGRGDVVVPFAHGQRVAELVPGAELVALEDRGHMLLPDDYDRVAAEVARLVFCAAAERLRAAGGVVEPPAAAAGAGPGGADVKEADA